MNIAIINNAVYLVKCMAEKNEIKKYKLPNMKQMQHIFCEEKKYRHTWNRCSTYSVKKRNTDIFIEEYNLTIFYVNHRL